MHAVNGGRGMGSWWNFGTVAFALAVAFALGVHGRSVDAAPLAALTWGSATNISGDSDVDTTGTLLYAYNFGSQSSATTQTVNGVTFQPFVIFDNAGPQTTGNVTVSELDPHYLVSDLNVGSVNAPFSGLSASYRAILSSEVYGSNFGDIQVDLGGLTPGTDYRLQWWTNDSAAARSLGNSFYFENTYGTGSLGSVTLDSNTISGTGGLGQYVIGTFTATGTAASFTLTGSGTGITTFPMMNALQVRAVAVPEPATCIAAMAGLACGGFSIWRRRMRA